MKERFVKNFKRTFRLPSDVDVSNIDAEIENGNFKYYLIQK